MTSDRSGQPQNKGCFQWRGLTKILPPSIRKISVLASYGGAPPTTVSCSHSGIEWALDQYIFGKLVPGVLTERRSRTNRFSFQYGENGTDSRISLAGSSTYRRALSSRKFPASARRASCRGIAFFVSQCCNSLTSWEKRNRTKVGVFRYSMSAASMNSSSLTSRAKDRRRLSSVSPSVLFRASIMEE